MKIYPPLLPCLIYAGKTFGIISLVLFGFATAGRLLKHQPIFPYSISGLLSIAIAIGCITAAFTLVVYVGARVWAWNVDRTGISGRSYWGRHIEMRWSDVDSVQVTSVQGIPALLIGSTSAKKEIFAYTLGVDIKQIYSALFRFTGPDHILTQCFREN